MNIRRAIASDGPAYLDLVCDLADFESLPRPDQAARERLLHDAFVADPPKYELWVAELPTTTLTSDGENGGSEQVGDERAEVIAYAVTFTTYSTFLARPSLYLEDLFVHPRGRRRGVARALIEHLRSEAEHRGCGRFEWMVLDWNRDAQALYHRVGAEAKKEWLLMRIVL